MTTRKPRAVPKPVMAWALVSPYINRINPHNLWATRKGARKFRNDLLRDYDIIRVEIRPIRRKRK